MGRRRHGVQLLHVPRARSDDSHAAENLGPLRLVLLLGQESFIPQLRELPHLTRRIGWHRGSLHWIRSARRCLCGRCRAPLAEHDNQDDKPGHTNDQNQPDGDDCGVLLLRRRAAVLDLSTRSWRPRAWVTSRP